MKYLFVSVKVDILRFHMENDFHQTIHHAYAAGFGSTNKILEDISVYRWINLTDDYAGFYFSFQ